MKNQISTMTSEKYRNVEYITDSGMKVKCVYPESVPENIRRLKINRMYDILSSKKSEK